MKIKNKKGFSIGEVMIAVFILTFGIISTVFLSARSIATISDSRKAVIAASLAQEGVELTRSVRDNNVTQSGTNCGNKQCTSFDTGSDYGWPSLPAGGGVCMADYTLKESATVGLHCGIPPELEQIYLDDITGFYKHGTGIVTPFKRIIFVDYYDTQTGGSINAAPNGDIDRVAAKVTSVVTWQDDADFAMTIRNADGVEANCKLSKQCAFAQTKLTSWINYE